jgi:integrase
VAAGQPQSHRGSERSKLDYLGVPDVTSHSFRKSGATMIYDAGLSARVGADQLGEPC